MASVGWYCKRSPENTRYLQAGMDRIYDEIGAWWRSEGGVFVGDLKDGAYVDDMSL